VISMDQTAPNLNDTTNCVLTTPHRTFNLDANSWIFYSSHWAPSFRNRTVLLHELSSYRATNFSRVFNTLSMDLQLLLYRGDRLCDSVHIFPSAGRTPGLGGRGVGIHLALFLRRASTTSAINDFYVRKPYLALN
jgi:hypothetical protein